MPAERPRPRLDDGNIAASARRVSAAIATLPQDTIRDIAKEALARVAEAAQQGAGVPSQATVLAFCAALLSSDFEAGPRYIEDVLRRGLTVDEIYRNLLPAAACRLGEMWDEGDASLLDVTHATARLHVIVRNLAMAHRDPVPVTGREAVFATIPGETHTLGVRIATNLFRRDRWEILLLVGLSHEELVERITAADAQLVGLSAGGQHAGPALTGLILALRLQKPGCKIVVCGQIVDVAREAVEAALPDACAADFDEAKAALEGFLYDGDLA